MLNTDDQIDALEQKHSENGWHLAYLAARATVDGDARQHPGKIGDKQFSEMMVAAAATRGVRIEFSPRTVARYRHAWQMFEDTRPDLRPAWKEAYRRINSEEWYERQEKYQHNLLNEAPADDLTEQLTDEQRVNLFA